MPELVWIKNVLKKRSTVIKERKGREWIYMRTLVKTRLETPLIKGIQIFNILKKNDEEISFVKTYPVISSIASHVLPYITDA